MILAENLNCLIVKIIGGRFRDSKTIKIARHIKNLFANRLLQLPALQAAFNSLIFNWSYIE
ncbi:hypothetical protein AOB57_005630 [Methanosarcina flavescens]|uniref:Uncharacterized protein n=1 Tax=Methanosarcina flavescens TaxID=1715806 RepID=A0A660HR60_9EURY|nr:hypothetical protein AOB57_005630 [Methanosarcina flavescens]